MNAEPEQNGATSLAQPVRPPAAAPGMSRMYTRELTGKALSFAAALACRHELVEYDAHYRDRAQKAGVEDSRIEQHLHGHPDRGQWMICVNARLACVPAYGSDANLGLKLIEDTGVQLGRADDRMVHPSPGGYLLATKGQIYCKGISYLEAGVRCVVLCRLGEYVDVPEKVVEEEMAEREGGRSPMPAGAGTKPESAGGSSARQREAG